REQTNLMVEFDIKMSTTYYASTRSYVQFQYSLDGGSSWTTLGNNSNSEWYGVAPHRSQTGWGDNNTINEWTTVRHRLCVPSGEECVRFRLYFHDVRGNDRFAFDNFRLYDRQGDDLEPIAIYPPDSRKCGSFGAAESVGIVVQNNTC